MSAKKTSPMTTATVAAPKHQRAVIFYSGGDGMISFRRLIRVFGIADDVLLRYIRQFSNADSEDDDENSDDGGSGDSSSGSGAALLGEIFSGYMGTNLKEYFESARARYDNPFGFVVGPYGSFFVRVTDVLPDKEDLILCFVNSCKYDLPACLEILLGKWHGTPIDRDFIEPEQHELATIAFDGLHCPTGKVNVVYGGLDEPTEQKYAGVKYRMVNDEKNFVELFGTHHSESLTTRLHKAWKAWDEF